MILTVELSLPATNPTVPQVRRVDVPTKDWKFPIELQEGELFYRTKLSGSLTVSGADFAWLYSQWERLPCCVEVDMNVFKPACDQDGDDLLWPGYFNLSAVRWNFTDCTAEVRDILPRDGYDALFRVWEKPINVIAAGINKQPFVAFYRDTYASVIDSNGNQAIGPPDGNVPGTGYQNTEHVYTRAITLDYALQTLLYESAKGTKAEPLMGVISEFYFTSINPVTGRKNLDKLIMAGSDAKRPVSTAPAVKLMATLKEFLYELRALHNVYFVITETNFLKLEHYSWFAQRSYENLNRVSLNLTRFPEALAKANNESTDLEGLYGIEELVISNNAPSFFTEYRLGSVRYDDGCMIRDDKGVVQINTMTAERFYTDIYAGYGSPDSVPDDSIFLCDIVPPKTFASAVSNLPQLAVANNPAEYPGYESLLVKIGTNGYQSAALLFIDYHRHGRSYTSGLVNAVKQQDGSYANGIRMSMLSTKPTRRQEGITIPLCCTDLPLNLNGYVKTQRFALGKMDKGVFDPSTDTLQMDVVASSRCQQIVVTPGDPGEDCPPKGTIVSGRGEQTYCDGEQQIVATSQDIFIYADGACGTYEEPGPLQSTGNC
ncbi:hypothetical protein [Spirosoma utsteinense]|uniref:hypothetical protein n=1 Tax=Spirosoma utsteinense TaxID=2585773 RepID=UPI001648370C|nr:hypothetical protein [Spirosoma utsteinense]MBC3785710.1 hypothetical protein [Spirosoma utsteinense]